MLSVRTDGRVYRLYAVRCLRKISRYSHSAPLSLSMGATPVVKDTVAHLGMANSGPMDRYRAQQPYMNSLPPIELKEPQPAQAPAENSRTVTTNRQITVNTSVDGGISSLTRDEISRLTDKVYERIENRLARERRRMGL